MRSPLLAVDLGLAVLFDRRARSPAPPRHRGSAPGSRTRPHWSRSVRRHRSRRSPRRWPISLFAVDFHPLRRDELHRGADLRRRAVLEVKDDDRGLVVRDVPDRVVDDAPKRPDFTRFGLHEPADLVDAVGADPAEASTKRPTSGNARQFEASGWRWVQLTRMWRRVPKRPAWAASARARCPAWPAHVERDPKLHSRVPAGVHQGAPRPRGPSPSVSPRRRACRHRAAASPCAAWILSGEAMMTASSSGSASSSSRSSWAGVAEAAPCRAAKSAASPSGRATARSRAGRLPRR